MKRIRWLALLPAAAHALPATAASGGRRWSPGSEVASDVAGEVEPRRRAPTDGAYGRFDGDLDLGLGLGVEASGGAFAGAARSSLHSFSMAGVYASYVDALGHEATNGRLLAVGVDVRPAFLPRWSRDAETGPAFLDLALDSSSLGLGAFWSQPADGALGDSRGFEASLGLGIPLLGRAAGPWLEGRGTLRWADGTQRDTDPAFTVVLSWHAVFTSWLVHDAQRP